MGWPLMGQPKVKHQHQYQYTTLLASCQGQGTGTPPASIPQSSGLFIIIHSHHLMVGRLAISYDEHIVPLLPFLFLELIQGERERESSLSLHPIATGRGEPNSRIWYLQFSTNNNKWWHPTHWRERDEIESLTTTQKRKKKRTHTHEETWVN